MADRLISVPAARSHINAVVADPILKACMHNVLDGLPAADAVEVVRCKDCDYKVFDEESQEYYCNHAFGMYGEIKDNDFCSYGERKKDG